MQFRVLCLETRKFPLRVWNEHSFLVFSSAWGLDVFWSCFCHSGHESRGRSMLCFLAGLEFVKLLMLRFKLRFL